MRRRPCRICRRWFSPHPRVQDRQMTCGDSDCKREWHRKKCSEWNRKNENYFRTNYLQKKLDAVSRAEGGSGGSPPPSRFHSRLPRRKVQEVIGVEDLVILEYLVQLLWSRFQEAMRVQVAVRTG
jgi:hypothetical protein